MIKLPVFIGLSPNLASADFLSALKMLLRPFRWKTGYELNKVYEWFSRFFPGKKLYFLDSARSCLYLILKASGIGRGDEVIIQAFTCVAVADPIIWVGAKPVYADVDKSMNLNPMDLEGKISEKTKAVIVQHTFGVPAQMDKILEIAKKRGLLLIEDCSHSLGSEYRGKKVGTLGDLSFFSFGRDKVISSVFGGMIAAPIKNRRFHKDLSILYARLKYPDMLWIFKQLLHPVLMYLFLPLYRIRIGKIALFVLKRLGVLSSPVDEKEKSAIMPKGFCRLYPNALAGLLISQLSRFNDMLRLKKRLTDYYFEKLSILKSFSLPLRGQGANILRFNILSDDCEKIFTLFKKSRFQLGNWYKNIIDPKGTDYTKIFYRKGSCPKAETASRLSINLPVLSRMNTKDIDEIVKLLSDYENRYC